MLHLCISGFWERLVDVSTVTGVTSARLTMAAPAWRAAPETREKHGGRGRHDIPDSAQQLTTCGPCAPPCIRSWKSGVRCGQNRKQTLVTSSVRQGCSGYPGGDTQEDRQGQLTVMG